MSLSLSLELSEEIVSVIEKFYNGEMTPHDSKYFPFLDKDTNQLTCSFIPKDTKVYNGKTSATMKTNQVILIQKYLKSIIAQKKDVNFNKPEVCFFAYLLQQIKYNEKDGEDGVKDLYTYFINKLNDKTKLDETVSDFCIKIAPKICSLGFEAVNLLEDLKSIAQSDDAVDQIIQNIITELSKKYEDVKWDSIKILNLFYVYSNLYKRPISSILNKDFNKEKKYDIDQQKIVDNLTTFLKDKGILLSSNSRDIDTVIAAIAKYRPDKCTIINQDDPDFDNGTFYAEYTLDKIGTFLNLQDGHCMPIDYIALSLLASKGKPILYKNTHLLINISQVNVIATYIYKNFISDKIFRNDFLNNFKNNYTEDSLTHFIEENTKKDDFKTRWKNILNTTNTTNTTVELQDFITIFKSLISGNFTKNLQNESIQKLYYYSSNTIFELFGLLGYTYFSDMLTSMENPDGKNFIISSTCTAKILAFYENLQNIKVDDNTNLKSIVDGIEFGGESIKVILTKLNEICIHGVGKMCLRYYLNCYESFLDSMPTLETDCNPANPTKPAKQANSYKFKPLPNDQCDKFGEYFKLAPFIIKTPRKLNTLCKYLTCLPNDGDINKYDNPFIHSYIVSGFSTDLSQFYHLFYLFHIVETSHNNATDISKLLRINNSVYEIKAYSDSYFNPDLNNVRDTLVKYYRNNRKKLVKLLKIPYIFSKNRLQRFNAFSDFTLHMCKMMTTGNLSLEQIKDKLLVQTNNSKKENTLKYNSLSKLAKKEIEDIIMYMNVSQVPKHLILINYTSKTNIKNHLNSDFMNTSKNVNSFIDKINTEDRDISKYYVTSLPNLLSFPYTLTFDEKKSITAVIRTPDTRKDITPVYQYYKLIGDVIYTDAFDKINTRHKNFKDYFKYFESYCLNVVNQPLQLQEILFKNIISKDSKKEKKDRKYVNLSLLNADTFLEDPVINDYILYLVYMLIAYFYFVIPYNNDFNANIKSHLKLNNKVYDLDKIEKSLKETYRDVLDDIVTGICGEGLFEFVYKYHFTELDKEVLFLKYLDQEFPKTNRTYNDQNCILMIKKLNELVSIYKPTKLETDDVKSVLYTNEAKAIGFEYLVKLELLSQHTSRINYFRNMFEMSLANFMNIKQNDFNEKTGLVFKQFGDINTEHNKVKNANEFFKSVFTKYSINPLLNMAVTSNTLAELFNILPTIETEQSGQAAQAVGGKHIKKRKL
jgi:hypothetical protein